MDRSVSETDRERNWASGLKMETKGNHCWFAMLETAAKVEPADLKRELRRMINRCHDQLLDDKEQSEGACRLELEYQKQENVKLRKDFNAVQRQNENLRQLVHGRALAHYADQAPTITPWKRQRDPKLEDGDFDCGPPRRPIKAKPLSREMIKCVLGGFDRGWGSTRSKPLGCSGTEYVCHVLLDRAHLFGRSPSRGKNIPKAMFGFGQTDDDVISRGVVFPLFVRKSSERGAPFCYLGNYVASESEPVAWKRLSPEERGLALETLAGVQGKRHFKKILSTKGMVLTRDALCVPCCRLEFQSFDRALKVDIQYAPGRQR